MASDTQNNPAGQNQPGVNVEEGEAKRVPITDDSSISDMLSHPDTQRGLKYIVSLYALIGLGFGVLMLLIDNQFLGEGAGAELLSGALATVLFGLLVFIGPVIAALTAFDIAQRFTRPKQAWVTSAVGNGGGFIAMIVITVLFVNSVFTGSEGDLFNLSDLLVPLLLLAIPTAFVGVGATYIYNKFRYPEEREATV